MKKLVSLLLALAMLLGMTTAFGDASGFDLGFFTDEGYTDYYTIDVNEEEDVAFIECPLYTFGERAFEHVYEHPDYYSATWADILIVDYSTADAYPVLRLWIDYMTTQLVNIKAVSFTIDGTVYTFSEIDNENWIKEPEKGGYEEQMLVKFGDESVDFLVAVEEYISAYAAQNGDDITGIEIPMVLHGDEDIVTAMGENAVMDFYVMIEGMAYSNGDAFFDMAYESPMTTSAK